MDLATERGWIVGASRIVGFTGAGISTESGIPDFRSPDGVWARNRIVDFQEFVSSEEGRVEYWRQKVASWPAMRAAEPNSGPSCIRGTLPSGKARRAGHPEHRRPAPAFRAGRPDRVLELHGTTTEAACLSCGDRISSDEACRRVEAGERAPRCRLCGGFLKPATISFGQPMPVEVMERAWRAARNCDLMLVVGSSLVVEPAASIPRAAKSAGARLLIVNRERTPLDGIADSVVRGESGAVLPRLAGACA